VLKGFCLPELQGLQDSSRAASALPLEEDDGDEAFRLVEVVANRVAAVAAALAAVAAPSGWRSCRCSSRSHVNWVTCVSLPCLYTPKATIPY